MTELAPYLGQRVHVDVGDFCGDGTLTIEGEQLVLYGPPGHRLLDLSLDEVTHVTVAPFGPQPWAARAHVAIELRMQHWLHVWLRERAPVGLPCLDF